MVFGDKAAEELYLFLKEKYAKLYLMNDAAHQIDHIEGVLDRALSINRKLALELSERYIVIAAMIHDLFAVHRTNHETLAFIHLHSCKEDWLKDYTKIEISEIANACMEHRASYRGGYSSLLSELIATADRGEPKSVESQLARSKRYAMSALNKTEEQAEQHAISHIKEKFGSNGYSQYPPLYMRLYGEQLKEHQRKIDSL